MTPADTSLDHWIADVRRQWRGRAPDVALVLGSGFGDVAGNIESPLVIPYASLPGFPGSSVPGHAGRLLIGSLAGSIVVCMQGRHHAYEGGPDALLGAPIRLLSALGCHTVLLTNAAGSLSRQRLPGSLMLITDHINWAGVNPLAGDHDEGDGPCFVDMSEAYDAALRGHILAAASACSIELTDGVYVMAHGPAFETPAEVRALATLGGDAVGMSTVPECLVARQCGMRVAGLTLITNFGAGLADHPLTHEDTLAQAGAASATLEQLVMAMMPALAARP